ncbi:hypothetical protein [Sphingomonas antarctica]|uniref:hypothetical protein n=1 Tax=Sphingomonas antarctica TaxID=2040274 RepID=UPI0039EB70D3
MSISLFVMLPFHIVNREITVYGFVMLGLFIAAFCTGAWFKTPVIQQRHAAFFQMPDFKRADNLLMLVSIFSMIVLFIEFRSGSAGDLTAAYEIRSQRSTSLLNGDASGSSLAFQLGFLTSPVGYTVLVREIIYREKIKPLRMIILGFGPLILSSLALGGRGPLLLAFTLASFALLTKRTAFAEKVAKVKLRTRSRSSNFFLITISVIGVIVALNYFVTVFFLRAGEGGAAGMFDAIGDAWGVTFDGPVAEAMKATLGLGITYLIFVFSWYIVQGIVIANVLFTSYTGPAQLGIYGIELAGAVARRIDSNFVAVRNYSLFDLNVFGFVPSAFGTLYVDYWYFGILVAAGWGYLTSVVYLRSRTSSDARWLIAAPFMMQGVLYSGVNTPLGQTNGLVTFSWMIVTFMMAKPRKGKSLNPGSLQPRRKVA